MTPAHLDKLIQKYLEGQCTPEEREFINSWYGALGKMPQPGATCDEEQLKGVERRVLRHLESHAGAVEEPFKQRSKSLFFNYMTLAASIVFCAALAFYFVTRNGPSTAVTARGTVTDFVVVQNTGATSKRLILPDGSIVLMSPQSRVKYSCRPETASRELFLEGEAYFDVAHNSERPFYVYAGEVVTRVLGTTFVVHAFDGDKKVTVSVKTGKVTVYTKHATHKKTVLVPNQQAVYDAATNAVATLQEPMPQDSAVAREIVEMHFEETPVSEVLTELINTYDIDIVFQEDILSGCVLTSSFYEEGLYDRIDVICTAIGATYKIVDSRIVIESRGCNHKIE